MPAETRNDLVDWDTERALARHDRWGKEHTCADCGWCSMPTKQPEYARDVQAIKNTAPFVLSIVGEWGYCTQTDEWIDANATCADVCESNWVPF